MRRASGGARSKAPLTRSADVQGGATVFSRTRVPVDVLFDFLEDGQPLEAFLDQYPSVSRDQAIAVLEAAKSTLVTRIA